MVLMTNTAKQLLQDFEAAVLRLERAKPIGSIVSQEKYQQARENLRRYIERLEDRRTYPRDALDIG